MFSSLLFKEIPCPQGPEKCKLTNCLFSHKAAPPPAPAPSIIKTTSTADVGRENGDLKRRRLNDSSIERTPAVSGDEDDSYIKLDFTSQSPSSVTPSNGTKAAAGATSTTIKPLSSTTREVSPPPKAISKASITKPTNGSGPSKLPSRPQTQPPKKVEQLTPRIVKSGGPFQQRLTLLKHLHTELVRLNKTIKDSSEVDTMRDLLYSDNELVVMALDKEEEANAKGGALYRGLMTQKLAYYKKMSLEGWVKELRLVQEKESKAANGATPSSSPSNKPNKIETGLKPADEVVMLERFVLSPQQMSQAGFILTAPTDAQIADAVKTQESTGGYEACDRCGTRFQVLATPNAKTGSYTTNGTCRYHWGKPLFPKREKVDALNTVKEALYQCCNQPKGSPGCSTQTSHVYKISANSPGRLASVLQFSTTPLNQDAQKGMAVAFDCEMGYTTAGLEMIRLSACKWPSNESLVDVLVKPIGTILDLNTKFSGVTPRQFADATLFKPGTSPLPDKDGKMQIMAGPAAMRDLLCSFISPNTVLIGHAIDNDLNVLRLLHPTIVDTSLLYPHHAGLPYRFPLRKLAKDFLNLDIQTSNAAGHDSMEDSRATGDLVRVKVEREWKALQKQGWSVKDGKFYAKIGGVDRVATLPPYTANQGWVKKRKGEAFAITGQVGEQVGLGQLVREGEGEYRTTKL